MHCVLILLSNGKEPPSRHANGHILKILNHVPLPLHVEPIRQYDNRTTAQSNLSMGDHYIRYGRITCMLVYMVGIL